MAANYVFHRPGVMTLLARYGDSLQCRNRENLSYCKERGIRLSGPALGRPKKGEDQNKVQDYRDKCERVEVERKFILGTRKCGMGLVTAKLEETAAHVVALVESAYDSVRLFAILGLASRFSATLRNNDGYSVEINSSFSSNVYCRTT